MYGSIVRSFGSCTASPETAPGDFCRMSQCYPGGQWVSEGQAEIWNRCLSLLVPDLAGRGFVWFCVEL
jgi:hypothetical protein